MHHTRPAVCAISKLKPNHPKSRAEQSSPQRKTTTHKLLTPPRSHPSVKSTTIPFTLFVLFSRLAHLRHNVRGFTSFGSNFFGSNWFHRFWEPKRELRRFCFPSFLHSCLMVQRWKLSWIENAQNPSALHLLFVQCFGHLAVNTEHFGFSSRICFGVYSPSDGAQFIFQSPNNDYFLLQICYLNLCHVSFFLIENQQ